MVLHEHPQDAQQAVQLRGENSQQIPLQAPIGGWNTRDAYDDVSPEDALQMENWLPGLGKVSVRKGCTPWAYDPDDEVSSCESLMVYDYGGNRKMLACWRDVTTGTDEIFDVSTQTPAQLLSGSFGNRRWETAMFQDKMIMVNGSYTPQEFNGTAISNLSPTLVGPTNPVGCLTYKNRVYYWDSNDNSFWYTELHAYGGTCTEFDLDEVSKYGGHILHMDRLTVDGGQGPDDMMIIFMTSGEVIVYRGTSPASLADWSIVGSYYIGEPMGRRSFLKFANDFFIITELDIVNLQSLMMGEESLSQRTKISGAMESITSLSGTFGFDAEVFPKSKLVVFNIPDAGGTTYSQYVLNIITKAWCKFTGWNAMCWARFDDEIFFGGTDGVVYKAFDGYTDDLIDQSTPSAKTTVSNQIDSVLQTAWLSFGSPQNKVFHAMKPILRTVGDVYLNAAFATDFAPHAPLLTPVATEAAGTPWGSPWGSPWGPSEKADVEWQISDGYGRWMSALIKMGTKNQLALAATLWHIEVGVSM